jgi:hypothetical protein
LHGFFGGVEIKWHFGKGPGMNPYEMTMNPEGEVSIQIVKSTKYSLLVHFCVPRYFDPSFMFLAMLFGANSVMPQLPHEIWIEIIKSAAYSI